MKRARVAEDCFTNFWHLFFAYCGDVLFRRLATFDGAFRYEQRHIPFRIRVGEGQVSFVTRNVYHKPEDVKDAFFRFPSALPISIEFSGLAPAHHLRFRPVYPRKDELVPKGYRDAPRESDREYVRSRIATWLGELVLDVDLSEVEYDRRGICKCVGKARCCDKCWRTFMTPAIKTIIYLLEHVFNLRAFFFVYSGRRGFHVWVIDRAAVMWTGEQRSTFINTLNALYEGPRAKTAVVEHIYKEILKPAFNASPALRARFLPPSLPSRQHRKDARREFVFKTLYPKFDVAVTRDTTHNHKLPLVLHPETKKLCITMQRGEEADFLPSNYQYDKDMVTRALLMQCLKPIEQALDAAGFPLHEDEEEEEECKYAFI